MSLATKKRVKIALKKIYTLLHFIQWRSTLVNHELVLYHKIPYYIGTSFEVLSMYII